MEWTFGKWMLAGVAGFGLLALAYYALLAVLGVVLLGILVSMANNG